MARFALVVGDRIVNIIEAEPGFKHPGGTLISCEALTVDAARRKGILFAESDQDFSEAYVNNSPLVHGPMSEHQIFDLLNAPTLPPGLIVQTSGTTGTSKLVCTPWSTLEQRAAAFMELVGPDFTGPLWFPGPFKSTLGSSTARLACIMNGINVSYGKKPDDPFSVVLATPSLLRRIYNDEIELPKDVVVMAGSATVDDNLARAYLEQGNRFIDFYSSTEAGAVCMIEYFLSEGSLSLQTKWATNVIHRIGIDGTLELTGDQISNSYLTTPLIKRGGYYDTRDIVDFTPDGVMRVLGRKPTL